MQRKESFWINSCKNTSSGSITGYKQFEVTATKAAQGLPYVMAVCISGPVIQMKRWYKRFFSVIRVEKASDVSFNIKIVQSY